MFLLYAVCFLNFGVVLANDPISDGVFKTPDEAMKYLKNHITALTRQTMLQQFFSESRVRTEGQSGIKIVRQRKAGKYNYFTETHSGYSAASIHDHNNNIRTVGMGEFTGVLNGIEFKTRHNDYSLRMPHRTSKDFHATEPIPFPDVPPEVLAKGTVDEQISEMREWFKAWRDQDYSKRDYRKYFKPTLCYLEGAWTTSGSKIDEPFSSDRHFIDASTWMELHDKARFVSYTGTKSRLENLSFLPTKIIGLKNESIPVFAQWNYRILCHPLKKDVPISKLNLVEDLSSRMMTGNSIYRHLHSRAARFQIKPTDNDRPISDASLLDELMEEIPGKDNYQGMLYDEGLDSPVMNEDDTMKDVSRYHRWYRVEGRDAMGTSKIHRGNNDDFMFAAMNTQQRVAGLGVQKCKNKWVKDTYNLFQRWSYAVPLELIYMTPLYSWNPHKLKHQGEHNKVRKTVTANGRNGDCRSKTKGYNGTTTKLYYNTPVEFYIGGNVGRTAADTSRSVVCVIDENGVNKQVRASGTHVFLPYIKDVGILRTRYPIFPVHGEGSSVWKELNALRDIVMKNLTRMHWGKDQIDKDEGSDILELTMGDSLNQVVSPHNHQIELTKSEQSQLKGGRMLYKLTNLAIGHQHKLRVRYSEKNKNYFYNQCDGKWSCFDRHPKGLQVVKLDEMATP